MRRRPVNQEEHEEEQDTLDFTKPDYVFLPKGNHFYRQQGYYLVCKSCEITHAVWIGPDHLMVGCKEDGSPVLKKRKELGQ